MISYRSQGLHRCQLNGKSIARLLSMLKLLPPLPPLEAGEPEGFKVSLSLALAARSAEI